MNYLFLVEKFEIANNEKWEITSSHFRNDWQVRYGISGCILKWIRSFLENRTQKVKIANEFSEPSKVTSGIPQGNILGPILFTIFINDLPEAIKSICKIFADDTKIYNITDKHNTLQEDLNSLITWSEKWQLFFNGQK